MLKIFNEPLIKILFIDSTIFFAQLIINMLGTKLQKSSALIFIALLIISSQAFQCPLQNYQGNIHSSTILAALNGGAFPFSDDEDTQCYNYTLPYPFASIPSIAISVHQFELEPSKFIHFFVKPIRSTSLSQVPFIIQTPWPYTKWNYLYFSFIVQDRGDIEVDYYQVDSGPLSGCQNGKSIDILLSFKNQYMRGKAIQHYVFLHGFQISTVKQKSDKRSPYELQINSSSSNVTGIRISLSVTTSTKVNYVYISYVAYQSSYLDTNGGTFIFDGTNFNNSDLFYSPEKMMPRNFARMYGLSGFILNYHEDRIKFSCLWDGFKFAFQLGKNRIYLKYLLVSYIFFSGSQCQDCPGYELYFNNSCLNECPYGTTKTLENTCITCGEGKAWNGMQCVPACSKGRYFNLSSSQCQCPPALHWNGQACIACYAGKVWSSINNACECEKPLTWNGIACAKIDPCLNGKVFDIYTYSCQCPQTTFWNGTICLDLPQCKNGQVLDSNYECNCPQGSVWDSNSCISSQCVGGQIWTGSKCVCPVGRNFNGSLCIECINGQVWNPYILRCQCPPGQKWNGFRCWTNGDCSNGRIFDPVLKKCICPQGRKWVGYQCIEIECTENQYFDFTLEKCVCISNFHWNGKICVQCDGGHIWNVTTQSCSCPIGTAQTKQGCKFLQQCTGGKEWNQNSWSCECPNGSYWTGSYCVLNPCVPGQVWDSKLLSCKCVGNKILNGNSCVPPQIICTNGRVWDPSIYACVCPQSTYPGLVKCQPLPKCTGQKFFNPFNNQCQCPFDHKEVNQTCTKPKCKNFQEYYNGYSCEEYPCPASAYYFRGLCIFGEISDCSGGYRWDGRTCIFQQIFCPRGTTWNGTTCLSSGKCEQGYYLSQTSNCVALAQQCIPPTFWDGKKCAMNGVNCPKGTYDIQNSKCMPYEVCKNNLVWDSRYLICVCPEGMINKGSECIQCGNGKIWFPDFGCQCPEGSFDTGSSCQKLPPGKCSSITNSIWINNKCQCRPGFTKVGFQCVCHGIQIEDLCDKCSEKPNSKYNSVTRKCTCLEDFTAIGKDCVPNYLQLGNDSPYKCAVGSYFNHNLGICLGCSPGCLSCSDGQKCKVCRPEFVYDYIGEKCIEKCGDGVRIVQECDDGNNIDGDGCSRDCRIEPDFTCTGGSVTTPDNCYLIGQNFRLLMLLSQVKTASSIILKFRIINMPTKILLSKQLCGDKCSELLMGTIPDGYQKAHSITSQYLPGTRYIFVMRVEFAKQVTERFKMKIEFKNKNVSGIEAQIEVQPKYLKQIRSKQVSD